MDTSDIACNALADEAERQYEAGDMVACLAALDAAFQSARQLGHPACEVRAHVLAAQRALELRLPELATQHVCCAVALAEHCHSAELKARVAVASAVASLGLADKDHALVEIERARATALDSGSVPLRFEFHMALAYVQMTLGQQEEGLASAQRALALSPQLGSAPRKSAALGNVAGRWYALGFALKRRGNTAEGYAALEKAVEFGHQACAAAEAAGAIRQNLSNLNNLAGALTALQRHAEALAAFQAHGALAQELGLLGSRPHALVNQGRLLRDLGDLPAARACILDAVAISNAATSKLVFPLPHLVLSELDEAEGDYRSALAHHKRFIQLESEVKDAAAHLQARTLAIRLNTDLALREAEQEHHRADALQEANTNLQAQAAALGREALQDALTGLANRRQVDRQLQARHAAALQAGQSACVAFMDVDHFKRVNDVHSHAIGDRVLVELARLFESHCREGDLAGRYGGEEFVLVFSRATLAQAKAACERLRLAVQGHDWDTVATGLRVTISMGLADTGKHANLPDGLAAADAQLYVAKREGRNRVCTS